MVGEKPEDFRHFLRFFFKKNIGMFKFPGMNTNRSIYIFCTFNFFVFFQILPFRELTYPTKREVWKIIDSKSTFQRGMAVTVVPRRVH